MSDVPGFPYAQLSGGRRIESVVNLTRADGTGFMEIVGKAGIRTEVTVFPLDQANAAIARLRRGGIDGATVVVP